jgi:two-component system chemotaxis sensor kinase CheA
MQNVADKSSYNNIEYSSQNIIGNLVIDIPTVTPNTLGKELHELFESMSELEGVIVLDNNFPIGLIMRSDYYNKIGTQYGFALIINRPITFIMDTTPLIVDYSAEVSQIGVRAMNRPQSSLYDFVIVIKDGKYMGAVSIRLFLVELSKKREHEYKMLKAQHNDLQIANEKEIKLRSKLEITTSSIKNLLDNAGQGFLSFGKDYIIDKEHSLECNNIFNTQIGGLDYIDLISEFYPLEKKEQFEMILKSYFQNKIPIKDEAFLWLMPKVCVINLKTIKLEYKRINFLGKKKIMIILTDISEKAALEKWMEKERQNQRLIIKALKNFSELNRMLEDISEIFRFGISNILGGDSDPKLALNEIFRIVHTLKGDFAQFGMYNSAKELHELEDKLSVMSNNLEDVTIKSLIEWQMKIDVNSITQEDITIIKNTLGDSYLDSKDMLTVSREEINDIEKTILKNFEKDQQSVILPSILKLKHKNIKEIMLEYSDYVNYLSERLGKSTPSFDVSGDDIYIEPSYYYETFKSIVHLFRNMIDHGIELPDDRLKNNKDPQGKIKCEVLFDNDNIQIYISDDGNGIDLNIIKQKAIERGLLTNEDVNQMNDDEILQIIFEPNFSTKKEISSVSGRGVGMSAVMEAVKVIRGSINVSTELGKGTTYKLLIPYKKYDNFERNQL